ncbi:MAG: tetratricopeptide repeat protein, partial [Bacteroidota bacterium]
SILNNLAFKMRLISPEQSLKYAQQSLELSEEMGIKAYIANAYLLLGIIYKNTGKLDDAIDAYLKSLKIAEEIDDSARISSCYNNLGNIYQLQEKYNKAIEFYNKSLEIEERNGNPLQVSLRYYNIGAIYELLDSLNEAYEYYMNSLKIEQEQHNYEGIYYAQYGLAGIETKRGNYSEAMDYINEAIANAEKTNNQLGKILCFSELARIYSAQKKYESAILWYKKSIELARTIEYVNEIKEGYRELVDIYKETGDFANALDYLEKFNAINDSVSSLEINTRVAELETQYETAKKEQQIRQQKIELAAKEAENEKKAAQRNLLLIGMGLLVILAVVILFTYFQKKAANRLLEEKNEEISTQRDRLREINRELQELSVVASHTDNSVLVADSNGNIEWINEGFTRLFGFTKEELIESYGKNISSSSKNPKIRELIKECIDNKKTVIYQSDNFSKSGKTIWTQTTLTPVISSEGKVIKLVAIDSDISKLKEAEILIMQKSEELEKRNIMVMDSIRYAKKIQSAIFPSVERFSKFFPGSFLFFSPRDIVSGDFYWLSCVEHKHLVAVADCTGHGVPGAFMSMIGNTLLNEIVNERKITDPEKILHQMNHGIRAALHNQAGISDAQNDGMDITVCSFDLKTGNIEIAMANHQACIVSNGKARIIEGDIYPVGGMFTDNPEHVKYPGFKIELHPGDVLFLYTDGYKDQLGETTNKKYGPERFYNLLSEVSAIDSGKQEKRLQEEFIAWKGSRKQTDDVLVTGIRNTFRT